MNILQGQPWRNYQFKFSIIMMTLSHGNNFYLTGPLCGNSPVTGEFPSQRSVARSFGVFFDLRPNKRLSKQSWGWWTETPWRSFWRHCNELKFSIIIFAHNIVSWKNVNSPVGRSGNICILVWAKYRSCIWTELVKYIIRNLKMRWRRQNDTGNHRVSFTNIDRI